MLDQDLSISQLRDYAVSLRDIRGRRRRLRHGAVHRLRHLPRRRVDRRRRQAKGMADLGEALRTDTMDDYVDVFVTP